VKYSYLKIAKQTGFPKFNFNLLYKRSINKILFSRQFIAATIILPNISLLYIISLFGELIKNYTILKQMKTESVRSFVCLVEELNGALIFKEVYTKY